MPRGCSILRSLYEPPAVFEASFTSAERRPSQGVNLAKPNEPVQGDKVAAREAQGGAEH